MISQKAMRNVLAYLEVFPPFLDVVHEFGSRTERPSDCRGNFQVHSDHESHVTGKFCHMLRALSRSDESGFDGRPPSGLREAVRNFCR